MDVPLWKNFAESTGLRFTPPYAWRGYNVEDAQDIDAIILPARSRKRYFATRFP